MKQQVDVLVVGAGPAGMAAALRLHRAGLDVLAVDRARFPRDKPCAEYLSPGTLAELAHLGLLPAVDAAGGAPLRGTAVFGPHGGRLHGRFAEAGGQPIRPTGLSLARRVLDAALVDAARAEGLPIAEGTAVERLIYETGAVAGALLRHEGERRACRARLVIGADGLRSIVARHLGGRVQRGPDRMAMVAHLRGMGELGEMAQMHVGQRAYVGLNPLGHDLTNVAVVLPSSRVAEARGRPDAFFAETLRRFPTIVDRLATAQPTGRVQTTGPFALRSRRVVAAGALLVGDAAEFHDPFTGEGIGSALRGGALAAEAAIEALHAGGRATARRLRPYLAARRRAFLGKWIIERLISQAVEAPAWFDRMVDRLERRGLGHTLVGVTGNFLPARAILNARVLATMVH